MQIEFVWPPSVAWLDQSDAAVAEVHIAAREAALAEFKDPLLRALIRVAVEEEVRTKKVYYWEQRVRTWCTTWNSLMNRFGYTEDQVA